MFGMILLFAVVLAIVGSGRFFKRSITSSDYELIAVIFLIILFGLFYGFANSDNRGYLRILSLIYALSFAVVIPMAILGFVVAATGYKVSSVGIFYGILPFVNGLFNFISFAASRKLLRLVVQSRTLFLVVTYIVLAILIAFTLLIALTVALPISLEIVNKSSNTPINWLSYAQLALNEPFKSGIVVTAMLFSTLLPITLYLLLSLGALCLPIIGWKFWLQQRFREKPLSNIISFLETLGIL